MKVKLLRQVRKRFEIIHYPNGFYSLGEYYNYNVFKLYDANYAFSAYRCITQFVNDDDCKLFGCVAFKTERECLNYLQAKIIELLKAEGFKNKKMKTITNTASKIWYNG